MKKKQEIIEKAWWDGGTRYKYEIKEGEIAKEVVLGCLTRSFKLLETSTTRNNLKSLVLK